MPSVPKKGILANSVVPYQTPLNAASDQGLHCLHQILGFLKTIVIMQTNETPLLLEMNLSNELKWKISMGVNGFNPCPAEPANALAMQTVDTDQLASKEANRSRSALFAIQYIINLY